MNKRERTKIIFKMLKERKTDDEIIDSLRAFPDFNEDRARWNVIFIKSLASMDE